jgi:hypothetical protein
LAYPGDLCFGFVQNSCRGLTWPLFRWGFDMRNSLPIN